MSFQAIKIALFDVDGTLVLSEHVHEERWYALAANYGVQMTKENFDKPQSFKLPDENGVFRKVSRPLRGAHEDVICHWIIGNMPNNGHHHSEYFPAMRGCLFDLYKERQHKIVPRRGIEDVVDNLANDGFLVAAVTGCHKGIADINLSVLTVAKRHLSFVITADDTTQHKPHPAPYILAFNKIADILQAQNGGERPSLEFLASRTGIVEDSPTGMKSGLAVDKTRCIQYLLPGQKPYTPEPASLLNRRAFPVRDAMGVQRMFRSFFKAEKAAA